MDSPDATVCVTANKTVAADHLGAGQTAALGHTVARYAQLAYPAGGVRADLGQLSQTFILSSLNRVLRFGLEAAVVNTRPDCPGSRLRCYVGQRTDLSDACWLG